MNVTDFIKELQELIKPHLSVKFDQIRVFNRWIIDATEEFLSAHGLEMNSTATAIMPKDKTYGQHAYVFTIKYDIERDKRITARIKGSVLKAKIEPTHKKIVEIESLIIKVQTIAGANRIKELNLEIVEADRQLDLLKIAKEDIQKDIDALIKKDVKLQFA